MSELIDRRALIDAIASIEDLRTLNTKTLGEIIAAIPSVNPDKWISVEERLPESGEHVLLCCEQRPIARRYVCDGFYAKAKTLPSYGFPDECAVEYDEDVDEYYLCEGWYEVIKHWGDYSSIVIDSFVTHWMPLPEPPKEVK